MNGRNEGTQQRREDGPTGLLDSVQACLERKHGETDFYLTQFLTGHSCFREYLHKYGHDDRTNYSLCDSSGENALHILFSCPRYGNERDNLEKLIADEYEI